MNNLADLDGEGDSGDLASNGVATGEFNVVYTDVGEETRTVSGEGTNGETGDAVVALDDNDPAGVRVSAPTAITLASTNVANASSPTTTAIMLLIFSSLGIFQRVGYQNIEASCNREFP